MFVEELEFDAWDLLRTFRGIHVVTVLPVLELKGIRKGWWSDVSMRKSLQLCL
jgi:hypothetical protein